MSLIALTFKTQLATQRRRFLLLLLRFSHTVVVFLLFSFFLPVFCS